MGLGRIVASAVLAFGVTSGVWAQQAEAPAPDADDGFLYDITIEGNTLSAMGLSGVGVPSVAAATGAAFVREIFTGTYAGQQG